MQVRQIPKWQIRLVDPLVAAPFKELASFTPEQALWAKSHGWPISIEVMTLDHAREWDSDVRAQIRRTTLESLLGTSETASNRPDDYWKLSWTMIFSTNEALNFVTKPMGEETRKTVKAHMYAVCTQGADCEEKSVIGMMLGLDRHLIPPPGPSEEHVFTWLLSAAPKEYLKLINVPEGLSLGRVLVDTAVQVSIGCGNEGRVLLHADPVGGDGLLAFYRGCLMESVPVQVAKLSRLRRNDGRYLIMTAEGAGAFFHKLRHFRKSAIGGKVGKGSPVKVR